MLEVRIYKSKRQFPDRLINNKEHFLSQVMEKKCTFKVQKITKP